VWGPALDPCLLCCQLTSLLLATGWQHPEPGWSWPSSGVFCCCTDLPGWCGVAKLFRGGWARDALAALAQAFSLPQIIGGAGPNRFFCLQVGLGRPAVSLVPSQVLARSRARVTVGTRALKRPFQPRPRLSLEEAAKLCHTAMEGVVGTQLHANAPATVQRRQKVAAEATEFFDWLPEEWGATLETAGPEHLLFFVQEHWLSEHGGGLPKPVPCHHGAGYYAWRLSGTRSWPAGIHA
jgi:hypothetical protein